MTIYFLSDAMIESVFSLFENQIDAPSFEAGCEEFLGIDCDEIVQRCVEHERLRNRLVACVEQCIQNCLWAHYLGSISKSEADAFMEDSWCILDFCEAYEKDSHSIL